MKNFVLIGLLLVAGCRAALPRWYAVGEPDRNGEALAGQNAAAALEARFGGVVADPAAEARMARVAGRLNCACGNAAASASFQILDSTDLNALSLPGPRIYITRTLYAQLGDDALLAAVIAHELAHVRAGDHFKARGADAADALRREMDADACAVQMLRTAGVAPDAMQGVLLLVQPALPPEWASARTTALAHLNTPEVRTAAAVGL